MVQRFSSTKTRTDSFVLGFNRQHRPKFCFWFSDTFCYAVGAWPERRGKFSSWSGKGGDKPEISSFFPPKKMFWIVDRRSGGSWTLQNGFQQGSPPKSEFFVRTSGFTCPVHRYVRLRLYCHDFRQFSRIKVLSPSPKSYSSFVAAKQPLKMIKALVFALVAISGVSPKFNLYLNSIKPTILSSPEVTKSRSYFFPIKPFKRNSTQ